MTTKARIEKLYSDLIDKYEMDMYGEKLTSDIYLIEENISRITKGDKVTERPGNVEVVFNDEHMTYLLAGYVASSIYDEMEAELAKIGLELADCDGSRATFTRAHQKIQAT